MPTQGNDTKTIVIDFKVLPNDAIKTIQDTKAKIENLKSTMAGMKAAGLENTETYIKLEAAMKDMQQVVRANQKVLLDSIKEQKAEGDSLNALRAQLRGLREEYENLSKAERESAEGTELLNKINSVTDEVKGLEFNLQDFGRNVGNYWSALEGFPGGKLILMFKSLGAGTMSLSQVFKLAGQSVAAFGKQLLALMANPIVAAIAAIAAVVMKLVDSFKKNDQAMTELQRTFAAFKPILDVINKGFQALVGIATKAVGAVGNAVRGFMKLIPGLRKYVEAEDDVVVKTDELEEAERQYAVNSAKRQEEISELKNKSAQADKYSVEQRKEFLRQALQLEQDELDEKKRVAEQKLEIERDRAAQEIGFAHYSQEAYDKMSDEAKNKLKELEVAVINATTEFNNGTRKMQSSLSNFTKQEEAEQKQRAKTAASSAKERLKNEKAALDALEKMWLEGIRNLQDKEYALTAQAGRKQIDDLKNRLKEEKNLSKTAKEAINRQIILMEADLQLKLGDLRKKYAEDNFDRELEQRRKYYQKVLEGLKEENVDAQVAVKLVLNDIDTDEIKKAADRDLERVKDIYESAQKELSDLQLGNISTDDITAKYADVWERNGINLGNALANMEALVEKYNQDVENATLYHNQFIAATEKASEEERLRIKLEGTKKLHDEEVKQLDLSRKHAEILQQITLAENYDEYGRNEIEKTRIMQEQAEERVKIAQDEYSRLAGERTKYTDEELAAMYGSVEEYNNLLLEAQLKVVESENAVKDSIKAVTDAMQAQRDAAIEAYSQLANSINDALNSLESLFDTLAESDDKYRKYSTALAMTQILISTAVSVATAIEGAIKASKDTGPLAAITLAANIAAMVGAVLSGIAQATATLKKAQGSAPAKPKFAHGGPVKGAGTGTSDSIPAMLSNGEYVIREKVVKEYGEDFFDRINFGLRKPVIDGIHFATGGLVSTLNTPMLNVDASISYDLMKDAMKQSMSEALLEMPNPVVSVREINDMQTRVTVKEYTSLQ